MTGARTGAGGRAIERLAARVVLLDALDRILLFRWEDPEGDAGAYWITPGGALEPGETHERAAARELAEELGLRPGDVALGPWIWTRTFLLPWRGRVYLQRERYLLARAARADVDTRGLDPLERRELRDHRWWTLEEMDAPGERFSPPNLPGLLRALLAEGPPDEPRTLDP